MKKVFITFIVIAFTLSLSACGEEMCVGKGGTEVPCSELNAEPVNDYFEAGTYIVGTDIEPGIYFFQMSFATGTIERLDSSDQVIASVTAETRLYIEVKSTDAKVVFSGGLLWPIDTVTPETDLTVWLVGGYLVGTEIEAGDYLFKMGPTATSATLTIVSAVDFESGSVIQTYTVDNTDGISVTIPASAYAIYVENGHVVVPE